MKRREFLTKGPEPVFLGLCLSLALLSKSPTSFALDLSVQNIEVTQAIQTPGNDVPLVARRLTAVRVTVGVTGASSAVPGINATLTVLVNGSPLAGSPFASSNGPIAAPLAPDRENENHTLNFEFLGPEPSTNVSLAAQLTFPSSVVASRFMSANAPVVNIVSPAPGTALPETAEVRWVATDRDGDELRFSSAYSPDGGRSFVPTAIDITDNSYVLNTGGLAGTTDGTIVVVATDGMRITTVEVSGLTIPARKPPTVFITAPGEGELFLEGASIILQAQADDLEDGSLDGDAVVWTSDVDGLLGHGRVLQIAGLSVGNHEITATATDSDRNSVSSHIHIAIESRNHPPDCSRAAASPSELWPPNSQLVVVGVVGVTDPDGDPVALSITGISQDEPLRGRGSGKTCPDGSGVGTAVASLRAERTGTPLQPGDGRVYHLSFSADDGKGGQCTGTVRVCVPHDQLLGHVCVDQGPLVDSTGPCS